MSQQRSDKHGPAIDDALQDPRHQSSSGKVIEVVPRTIP